jgi:hypothetical protein
MKKLLLFSLLAFLGLSMNAQDYTAIKFPNSPNPLPGCNGDFNTVLFQIIDTGTNGSNTNYAVTSSNPAAVIVAPISPIPLNGNVADGMQVYVPILYNITAGAAPGIYQIDLTMTCDGCPDPPVVVTFDIEVNETPQVSIGTYPGTLLCDDGDVQLVAEMGNGASDLSYIWTDGETTPSIWALAPGTYSVTVSNTCGQSSDAVTITAGGTPQILSQVCDNLGNQLITTVEASDPGSLGLTFQWFEDGAPIVNGGDYLIEQLTPTKSRLTVSNVDGNNHNLAIFQARVENDCGYKVSTGCVAVPIRLSYFSGTVQDEMVLLNWATESETNNEIFFIERSTDGQVFEQIGSIPGAGDSFSEIKYSFLDKTAMETGVEVLYYRLMQRDFDGAFTYSNVIVLPLEDVDGFEIISTIAETSVLNINLHNPIDGEVAAQIFDMNGRSFAVQSNPTVKGFNQIQLDILNLPGGIYFARVNNGKQQRTVKFFKN